MRGYAVKSSSEGLAQILAVPRGPSLPRGPCITRQAPPSSGNWSVAAAALLAGAGAVASKSSRSRSVSVSATRAGKVKPLAVSTDNGKDFEDPEQDSGAMGGSLLTSLMELDKEEADDYQSDDGDYGGRFVEVLQKRTEELAARNEQVLADGLKAGHRPVLLLPAMDWLFPDFAKEASGRISPLESPRGARLPPVGVDSFFEGIFIDATFGRGGFSKEILRRLGKNGRLLGLDIDVTARDPGRALEAEDDRFKWRWESFSKLDVALQELRRQNSQDPVWSSGKLCGVALDVGVSSPQLDELSRGFNLQNLKFGPDRPLDLRMNQEAGLPASEWLQTVSIEELAWVFNEYGGHDETSLEADRLAHIVLAEQKRNGPYTGMQRFASVVGRALQVPDDDEFDHPFLGLDHPARMAAQAIRMHLNQELSQLRAGLEASLRALEFGGRCVVSVFKSLEARVVKKFLHEHEDPPAELVKQLTKRRLVELYPLVGKDVDFAVRLRGVPLKPSVGETIQNRRARSGNLWVLEKVPRTCPKMSVKVRTEKTRFKEPAAPPLL